MQNPALLLIGVLELAFVWIVRLRENPSIWEKQDVQSKGKEYTKMIMFSEKSTPTNIKKTAKMQNPALLSTARLDLAFCWVVRLREKRSIWHQQDVQSKCKNIQKYVNSAYFLSITIIVTPALQLLFDFLIIL